MKDSRQNTEFRKKKRGPPKYKNKESKPVKQQKRKREYSCREHSYSSVAKSLPKFDSNDRIHDDDNIQVVCNGDVYAKAVLRATGFSAVSCSKLVHEDRISTLRPVPNVSFRSICEH
jgi:hypothetical protein